MSPEKAFQALQTQEGHTLFFSIGTDDVFYLTREIPTHATGWEKTDLSRSIPGTAKLFRVAQNIQTNKIDIILVMTRDHQDEVYTITELDNTDQTWSGDLTWEHRPFDYTGAEAPSSVEVSDIFIAESDIQYVIIDIAKDPGDPEQLVDRYYLDLSAEAQEKVWHRHDLPGDVQSGTIQSCLGRKHGQHIDGVYTLGSIGHERELMYTPIKNLRYPTLMPSPTRLTMPADAGAIATVRDRSGYTDLYVAGQEGLYYFDSRHQRNDSEGTLIIRSPLFAQAKTLHAHEKDGKIVIWGLNQAEKIFYSQAQTGHESEESSWSAPVPILSNVSEAASYLNHANSAKVIFAYRGSGDNNKLVKLSQDPTSSMWNQRSIVLPSTDIDDILEFDTYTTHVQLAGDDHLPIGNKTVHIKSSSPVAVYINNQFEVLSPDSVLSIDTDTQGKFTILQEVKSIGAVCYQMQVDGEATWVSVNPMQKVIEGMQAIQSGPDLAGVTVTNADGSTQDLVKPENRDHLDAIAHGIQQFATAAASMPQDGSVKDTTTHTGGTPNWNLHYQQVGGRASFSQNVASSAVQIEGAVDGLVGDLLHYAKEAWDEVSEFFIQHFEGEIRFFLKLENKLYRFVVDSYHAVANAIEFVLSKIEVFLEDLIKWLGFLFKWEDILRTHSVLKNMANQFLDHLEDELTNLKNGIDAKIGNLKTSLNQWAGNEQNHNSSGESSSISSASSNASPVAGQHDPQSHYGKYHLMNGIHFAKIGEHSAPTISAANTSQIEGILNNLKDTIGNDMPASLDSLISSFQDQVSSLSFEQIFQKILAFIGTAILDGAEILVNAILDIVILLIDGFKGMINSPLNIPILSWMYKHVITDGDELTFLDGICLAGAIPTTVIYKLIKSEAPFPDDDKSSNLISANSWSNFIAALSSSTSSGPVARGALDEDIPEIKAVMGLRLAAGLGSALHIAMSNAKRDIKDIPDDDPEYGEEVKAVKIGVYVAHFGTFLITTIPNYIAGYLTYSGDDSPPNTVPYVLTVVQKLTDMIAAIWNTIEEESPLKDWPKFSAGADAFLGTWAAFVAVFGLTDAEDLNKEKVTTAVANLLWDANRGLSPFASMDKIFQLKMVLMGLYGAGQVVVIGEYLNDLT